MKNLTLRCVLFASAALSAALSQGTAQAQTAVTSPRNPTTTAVQEVVVTANKKSERLQDVAMSVAAVSGEQLQRSQLVDLQDLATKVPGLDLVQGGEGGVGTRLILRGENTGGQGATVASVVDDVPLSNSGSNSFGGFFGSDFNTYDMSQVEVLKGPQGTLYGATAEGGLIKYVTNTPNPSGFHAGIEGDTTSIDHGGSGGAVKGFINVPLLDGTAALRLTGFDEYLPGWIDDRLTDATKINSEHRTGGRISALWRPTGDLTIRATALFQDDKNHSTDQVEVNGGSSKSPLSLANGYNYNTYQLEPNDAILALYDIDIEYNFHWAKFQSITSDGTLKTTFDSDIPTYANLLGPSSSVSEFGVFPLKKFNQEFRLSSEPGNALLGHNLDWQVGVFYTNESLPPVFDYIERAYPSGSDIQSLLFAGGTTNYNEVAGYADATYHFSPQFDVELGGRVFSNKQQAQDVQGGLLLGTPILALPAYKSSETNATYSFAPRWHITPDIMVYGRIASGYRPGGPERPVPGGPPSLPTEFSSDSTRNYEAGVKAAFLDKSVSVDISAFYINWTRIQIDESIPVGGVTYNITGNAGTAISKGVEWLIDWSPITGLTLGTAGAYTDAYLSATAPGIGGVSGDRLPYVPAVSANLHFDYEWRYGRYNPFVGGSFSYIGDRYSDFSISPLYNHQKIPDYTTLSLNAGVRKGPYTLEVYGKNLGDSKGVTYYTPYGAGVTGAQGTAVLIRPLTVGVRLVATY